MNEVERLETAIGFIRKGNLLGAADLLDESTGGMSRENGANCRRLAAVPNSALESALVEQLEAELSFSRTFGF